MVFIGLLLSCLFSLDFFLSLLFIVIFIVTFIVVFIDAFTLSANPKNESNPISKLRNQLTKVISRSTRQAGGRKGGVGRKEWIGSRRGAAEELKRSRRGAWSV